MTNAFAVVSFCDDVRFEAGGKRVIVGEYSDGLRVSKFPRTFDKLCAVVRISLDNKTEVSGLEFTLTLPDGTIQKEALDAPPQIDEPGRRVLSAVLRFYDIEVSEAGEIAAEVKISGTDQAIGTGRLRLKLEDAQQADDSKESEFFATVASAAHYARISHSLEEEDKKALAANILESICELSLLQQLADTEGVVYAWTSQTACNIWYPEKSSKKPKIKVETGQRYKIENETPFGFRVKFDADESDVIEFTLLSPFK